MPHYTLCPFFQSHLYPSMYKGTSDNGRMLIPKKGQTLISCECARILLTSKEAEMYLFKNFCASNNWENCAIAQMTMLKYERMNANEQETAKKDLSKKGLK